MPLTSLDAHAGLVVIDLQKGMLGLPTVRPVSEIADCAARLARAFRVRGWPVVLVNVTGAAPGRRDSGRTSITPSSDWTVLLPELEASTGDYLVSKKRPGAFIGTGLHEYLRQRGVTQVFLAGVSTSGGVESTGRSALDLGYNVVFVMDAMTDPDADAHRHCVERAFPRLGETTVTDAVLTLL